MTSVASSDVSSRARVSRCRGLRRRPDRLPAAIRRFAADLCEPSTLAGLAADLDAIAYTAAADASEPDAYRRAYVDGPRNLLDALLAQGQRPRRLVFASSTAVYAQDGGEVVDEDSPTEPPGLPRPARPRRGTRRALRAVRRDGRPLRRHLRSGPNLVGRSHPRRSDRRSPNGDSRTPTASTATTLRAASHTCCVSTTTAPSSVAVDEESARLDDVVRFVAGEIGIEPAIGTSSRRRGGDKLCSSARLRGSGFSFRFPTYREGYRDVLGRG